MVIPFQRSGWFMIKINWTTNQQGCFIENQVYLCTWNEIYRSSHIDPAFNGPDLQQMVCSDFIQP